ncbi:MAG: phospholipase D-like domain-containing protein [Opitutales bacterium]
MFFLIFLGMILGIVCLPYLLFRQDDLPKGTNLASPDYGFSHAELLIDRTVWNPDDQRHVLEHRIFDAMLSEIAAAETFLIADFFLWNPWRGAVESPGELRPLAEELAGALIRKRIENPDMPMLLITDPINRVYGDLSPAYFDELAAAGIPVVFTALDQLPDSNKLYAPQAWFWEKFLPAQKQGQARRSVPNPFDVEGEKLTLGQLARLLYFKANHRKVLIAGRTGDSARILVPSFNPADGSANHSNIGLLVEGPIARFAAESELEVAAWSSEEPGKVHGGLVSEAAEAIASIRQRVEAIPLDPIAGAGEPGVAYRSEGAIRDALLLQLQRAVSGTAIDIALFYFSDRQVVEALKASIERGAVVRVLLDANRDAFGREKNGIPNRMVAAELMELADRHDVMVRWAATHGEQFHSKVLRVSGPQQDLLFLGSANWTRRNLANLNLEANLLLRNAPDIFAEFDAYFDTLWRNADGHEESLPYAAWAEEGWSLWWKTRLYRFQEWSGASTF